MRTLGLIAILTSLGAPGAALAQAACLAPFAERREVSPSGRLYLVVRRARTGEAIEFDLCVRRAEAPPMTAASRGADASAAIGRDPADTLLAKGTSDQLPSELLVSDVLHGFLAFESHGRLGSASALRWFDARGKLCCDLTARQLLGRELPTAGTWSPFAWHTHVSLDDARRTAVVVSVAHEVREVALPSGAVSSPGLDVLLGWCVEGNLGRRLALLDALAARDKTALPAAERTLVALADANAEPMAIRLRAAFALRRLGHPRDFAPLFLAACAATDERDYALARLPVLLGAAAVAHLKPHLADPARPPGSAESEALVQLGRAELPALAELLCDPTLPATGQMAVLYALDVLDTRPAREAQMQALTGAAPGVAQQAVAFLQIHFEAWMLAPLIEILDRGCRVDERLAGVFIQHPTSSALAALRKAQQRAVRSGSPRSFLDAAIAACAR